jgi:hypothetical protein
MTERTIKFDHRDYATIQREIAYRQRLNRPLPEGESDTLGATLAEIVRDLWEYKRRYDGEIVELDDDNGPSRPESDKLE